MQLKVSTDSWLHVYMSSIVVAVCFFIRFFCFLWRICIMPKVKYLIVCCLLSQLQMNHCFVIQQGQVFNRRRETMQVVGNIMFCCLNRDGWLQQISQLTLTFGFTVYLAKLNPAYPPICMMLSSLELFLLSIFVISIIIMMCLLQNKCWQ